MRKIRPPASCLRAGASSAWRAGEGEGVRFDCGVESGTIVPPDYNSLLAKAIAFGADREEARRRLVRALRETFVAGVTSNRDYLVEALQRPEFVGGAGDDRISSKPRRRSAAAPDLEAIALAALLFVDRDGPCGADRGMARLAVEAFRRQGGVRGLGSPASARNGASRSAGETLAMRLLTRTEHDVRFVCRGIVGSAAYARDGDALWLDFKGACRAFLDRTYEPPQREGEHADGAVRAPVSGVIVGVEAPVRRPGAARAGAGDG